MHRWWIYQQQRFPLLLNGLLVAIFAAGMLGGSRLLRGAEGLPAPELLLGAWLTTLLFFLQIRVADEYKDAANDRLHRPYLPVPRGLVRLNELARLAGGAALLQFSLVLLLAPGLLPWLLLVWAFLGLMRIEFGLPRWLNAHPLVYTISHMLIMPLIALYLSAWDWQSAGQLPPRGLGWLLGLSFANGLLIEIGRKLRGPEAEEPGVVSYSALWGARRAALIWLGILLAAGACLAALGPHLHLPVIFLLGGAALTALIVTLRFMQRLTGRGGAFQSAAALWVAASYIGLVNA